MKFILPILLVSIMIGCSTPYTLQNSVRYTPSRKLDPAPKSIIVANGFDVKAQSYRDKKEEQFILLIDGVLEHMQTSIQNNSDVAVKVVRGLSVVPTKEDSCINAFFVMEKADYVVMVNRFNVYFDQTEVVVTKTEDGKSREAFYDIVSETDYKIVGREGMREIFPITVRRYHSSRNVLSGLLAAGPSIVSNHDDAVEITQVNVRQFLRNFFPGFETRHRQLYVNKEFSEIPTFLTANNPDAAIELCQRLSRSNDQNIAAKAYYNLAVIAEHNGEYEKIREYLEQSLRRTPLGFAQQMQDDYL